MRPAIYDPMIPPNTPSLSNLFKPRFLVFAHAGLENEAQDQVESNSHGSGGEEGNGYDACRVQGHVHDARHGKSDHAAPVDDLDRSKRYPAAANLQRAAHDVVVRDEKHAPRDSEDTAEAHEGIHLV